MLFGAADPGLPKRSENRCWAACCGRKSGSDYDGNRFPA
jgi:hypothetical protein